MTIKQLDGTVWPYPKNILTRNVDFTFGGSNPSSPDADKLYNGLLNIKVHRLAFTACLAMRVNNMHLRDSCYSRSMWLHISEEPYPSEELLVVNLQTD